MRGSIMHKINNSAINISKLFPFVTSCCLEDNSCSANAIVMKFYSQTDIVLDIQAYVKIGSTSAEVIDLLSIHFELFPFF